MEGYIIDFVDNEINYEDLLISALITIAPKEITLHYKHKTLRTPLDTIKNVSPAGSKNAGMQAVRINPLDRCVDRQCSMALKK